MILLSRAWITYAEARLKLAEDAEPIPDLIASRRKLTRAYRTEPFELAVEIVSPDQRFNRLREKGRVYLSWGHLKSIRWPGKPGRKRSNNQRVSRSKPIVQLVAIGGLSVPHAEAFRSSISTLRASS